MLDSGLTILTTTDDSRGLSDRILTFFDAVASSDLPWLLVVFGLAVLVAAHLIWWLERHHNPDFAVPYRRGIWDSFYWSVVTMSTVGYGDKVARGARGRALALVWIALGTLVFASFTAAIASSLAVNELRSEISGPSDLPGRRVATAGADFQKVQYGLMLSEDDPQLRERIDLALLELIESGVYQRLHDGWFGSSN